MFVKYIINIVVNNASRITILKQGILARSETVACNKVDFEQMRKQRWVSVRMRLTLYFLGVKETHLV